jgi:hypothetical protein
MQPGDRGLLRSKDSQNSQAFRSVKAQAKACGYILPDVYLFRDGRAVVVLGKITPISPGNNI